MSERKPSTEDLETLAAFLDQRLPPEERQAFLLRLDSEEALYEVFVESARELGDTPATVAPAAPPSRALPGWPLLLVLAAVLALIAVFSFL